MDLDTEFDLAEAAGLLGVSPEKLIRLGAKGTLTICVMAEEWPICTEDGAAKIFTGLVNLLPEDLKLSYVADFTKVRKVTTLNEGDVLTLDQPVELRRGKLFVAAEEFRRFRRKYGGLVGQAADAPPYLDSGHDWYSTQLAIAVQAWMDLFSDGHFDAAGTSTKHKIREWLSKYAGQLKSGTRENIAKLINPDDEKWGGAPRTPVKKT